MQIIPNKPSSPTLGDALLAQAGRASTADGSFEEHLMAYAQAQQDVDQGLEHSVTNALAANSQPSAPLQEAPYSVKSKTDAGTYTLEEVTFSKTELVELRQELVNAGAPPETLEKFDKLVNQPDGATLAQVMASLQPTNTPPKLTDDEKNALKGLLKKIDSTGGLEEKIMGLLEKGQAMAAWKHFSQALAGLDPSTSISIDKSEVAILGKALGLSATTQNQLMAGFGSAQSFELMPKQVSQLLGAAQSELTQRELEQKKLNKALDATLGPILNKARKRSQDEKEASSLQSRHVEQSKIMINKTVTGNANNTVETTATKVGSESKPTSNAFTKDMTAQADPAQQATAQTGQQLNTQAKGDVSTEIPKTQPKTEGKIAAEAQPVDSKAVAAGAQAQPKNNDVSRDQHNMFDDRNSGGNKNSGNTGWEALLGKVEVRPQTTTATNTNHTVVGSVQGVHTGLQTPGASTAAGAPAHISRQVASQVEQAMLSAMRDGNKKLELQLTPGDLGTLTLTLTTRNGEVSAIIRSERTETSDLMVRQLDMLRTNLEQQGIKVDKLEVQTQTQNQQNDPWQSMQQHNNQQEEHARREQLDRMRNLGKVRNSSTNVDVTTLEQGLQLTARTAENAAQSIHIVA